MQQYKWLYKANDDVLSFCTCKDAVAMSSGQLDCPWCGCGWLISCTQCRKAFTFAEVRASDISPVERGWEEVRIRGIEATEEEVNGWAESMAEAIEPFEVGDIVVYLDGEYFRLDSTDVHFEGYFAEHRLARLPHAEALADPPALDRKLGDTSYWLERELPDRDE